jgi:hypothetical protein
MCPDADGLTGSKTPIEALELGVATRDTPVSGLAANPAVG